MRQMNHIEIAAKLGYKPNTIRDNFVNKTVHGVRFPRPTVDFSQKNRTWLESDIDAFTEAVRKKRQR